MTRPKTRRRVPEKGDKRRFKRYVLERIIRPPSVGDMYWLYFGLDADGGSLWRVDGIGHAGLRLKKYRSAASFPFISLTREFTFGEWYHWCNQDRIVFANSVTELCQFAA